MTLQGRRPGDRRVRIERVQPRDYTVRPPARIRRPPSPALVLVVGFAVLIAIGTVILSLPISSERGTWSDPLVALFTATSAVCVTGLVVVDTATHWSLFGRTVIMILFQVDRIEMIRERRSHHDPAHVMHQARDIIRFILQPHD